MLLEGRKDSFGSGYHVTARRAATGERLLGLGLAVTLRMANHPAEFRAALEKLLADAVTALVRR